MLLPQEAQLKGVIGARWDALFSFFADKKHTVPFPITGYSQITLNIDGLNPLTNANGLTVNAAAGTIAATMPASVTSSIQQGTVAFRLSWVEPDGISVDYPVNGGITWIRP